MRNRRGYLVNGLSGLICLIGVLISCSITPSSQPDYEALYQDLLYPSVRITSLAGCGSGVIIHRKDAKDAKDTIYILTAAHVAGNEALADVELFGSTRALPAFVVATDTSKDLALLRLVLLNPHNPRLHRAKLAPRGYAPRIFTPVWVIGCSLGLSIKPTEGLITSLNERAYSSINHWGINAPIWPGNSGGGVFLKDSHELIGIVVWVRTCRGQLANTMGGIVPLDEIYEFLKGTKALSNKGTERK